MKILSCRLRYFKSLARSLKVTWLIRLDDGRKVKVIDFRDWEDTVIDGWVEGVEEYEIDLADRLFELTEYADYTNYEV